MIRASLARGVGKRYHLRLDHRAEAGRAAEMAEILNQPVLNIHPRPRDPGECCAKRNPRLG